MHAQLSTSAFDLREPQPDQVTWQFALRIRPELVGAPPVAELVSFRVPCAAVTLPAVAERSAQRYRYTSR